jgi:hypothetical protein
MVQLHRFLSCLLLATAPGTSSAFSPSSSSSVKHTRTTTKSTTTSTSSLHLAPQEAWNAYNDALVASPLLVKSVTAGTILGAADFAGQAIQEITKAEDAESKGVDFARAARFAFFGLVLQAPWNHFYYNFLDGAIPPTVEPWTPTTGIKVVIDQFVQAPVFTVLIFSFLGFLEGKSAEAIKKQLEEDYSDTMVANCK